jgi:hypothetical protein
MSYCRWSSDDFKCDLYIYQTAGNVYQIHVAGSHIAHIESIPPLPDIRIYPEEYMEAYKKQSEFLEHAQYIPLNLPHAGKSFVEPTLQSLKTRLLELRNIGYRFPESVFERIEEEIKDGRIH